MKKRLCSLIIIFALLFVSMPAYGQAFDTAAGVAVLMEAASGQILFAKNGDVPRPPASIAKMMTLLLAFEALERGDLSWDETTTVSRNAWSKEVEGSKMFLDINQVVSIRDLISGISIVSANDGCIALAEHLYGSEAAFVQHMNRRAQELGMTNTVFKNSTGLPAEGQVMSAMDIAILARELVNNHPEILTIEMEREFTFNNIRQHNRNPLLGRFPGADGLKTGWTTESGFSLVGTAKQATPDGAERRLISVVLNTGSDQERLSASQELLNHGFNGFRLTTAAKKGETVAQVPVKDGRRLNVPVTIETDASAVVPRGRENDLKLVVEQQELAAPLEIGAPAGYLLLQLDGETLRRVPLKTAEEMGRANFFVRTFRGILAFFRGLLNG
ncbi:MAG: D-alanyl-D-alanine carboxypeptidase [Clostridium sp.]|nr:D-alanyl-D-alanine carboxypeptidase [Clostridium sp.]